MPGRRRSSTVIQKDAIEQANIALQQLPEKPKDNWSLREAIETLKDTILTALDRGYTYEEVAEFLSEQGVKISPSSLKSYLTAARKDPAVKPEKGRRGRRPKSASVAASATATDASGEDAPKPRRGRKPKALVEAELAAAAAALSEASAAEPPAEEVTSEEAPVPRKRGPRSTTTRRGAGKSAARSSEAAEKPRGRGRRKSTEA